jgi:hypothetical protein
MFTISHKLRLFLQHRDVRSLASHAMQLDENTVLDICKVYNDLRTENFPPICLNLQTPLP